MLYMYTYLPYVALCVRGERGERGVTLPPIIVMRLSEMYRHNKKIYKKIYVWIMHILVITVV